MSTELTSRRYATRPPAGAGPGLVVQVEDRPDAATRHAWDQLVSRTPHTDVAQLSSWAQVRREAGFTPLFVLAARDGELVGGALVLHRTVLPGLAPVAYLPLGPVLPTGPDRDAVARAICDVVADLARHRFGALFVQPMAGDEQVSDLLLRRGFRRSTAGIAPAASVAVDLTDPSGGLRSGTRANVKRATRRGVRVREAGADDLPQVAELLAETAGHHGFPAPTLDHLRGLHTALDGHLHVFLAERDGVPLAADVLTGSGGLLTLRLTGMRRDDDTRKSGAAALLRWETMLWARAHGYVTVDLGGIPATAVEPIRAGHADLAARVDGRTYFKASFGGQPFHRPQAVELLSSAAMRVGYDLSRRSAVGRRLLGAAKQLLRAPRHG